MAYKNKEDAKQYQKQYRIDHKEYYKQYQKQYCIENKEDRKQYNKKYRLKNKEYYKQHNKKYRLKNKEYYKQHNKQYQKQKRKTDLRFNLNHRMSYAIWKSLKGNKAGRHWESLVGYTVEDLINHLKTTLPPHCTWNDYMEGKLHIDHRIPKSVFNFTKYTHIDFRNCWSLSNLQLLPAEENLIKGDKLKQPFQPSLKMAI